MELIKEECSECYSENTACVLLGEFPYQQAICHDCLADALVILRNAGIMNPCNYLPEMVVHVNSAQVADGFVRLEFEFPDRCPMPKDYVEAYIFEEWKPAIFATHGWDFPAWTAYNIHEGRHYVKCHDFPKWRHSLKSKFKETRTIGGICS